MEENTEEGKNPEKASVQEWFDRHKGVVKLIWLGMVLILLLMIFLSLRLYGITFMENYAFYASGGSTFLSGGSSSTGFDSNATNVMVDNHPDIDGCIRFVTISDEEIDFDAGNADKAVRVEAYWYRFENKTAAREYLNKLGEEKGRKRYVLNEYLFDDPDTDDEATYTSAALRRAAHAAHPYSRFRKRYRLGKDVGRIFRLGRGSCPSRKLLYLSKRMRSGLRGIEGYGDSRSPAGELSVSLFDDRYETRECYGNFRPYGWRKGAKFLSVRSCGRAA